MTTSVGETHLASLFVECIRDSYLVQHVTQPTRIRTGNEPSVLDLIFTNEEGMMSDLNYQSSLGKSDHLLISFSFNCYTTAVFQGSQQVKYNYHRGNYQSLKANLSRDEEFRGFDLSRSWSSLTEMSTGGDTHTNFTLHVMRLEQPPGWETMFQMRLYKSDNFLRRRLRE